MSVLTNLIEYCNPCVNQDLVQEQPVLGILYHPVQALVEILACHGAAWEDAPFVSLDQIQLEALQARSLAMARCTEKER